MTGASSRKKTLTFWNSGDSPTSWGVKGRSDPLASEVIFKKGRFFKAKGNFHLKEAVARDRASF